MYLFGCLKGVALLNLAIQSTRNFLKRVPMEMTESSEMMMRCLNAKRIPDLAILVAMMCIKPFKMVLRTQCIPSLTG